MASMCGANCGYCGRKELCKGCAETDGHPLGGSCAVAECYKKGGKKLFFEYKAQLIAEFNSLDIPGMPRVTELFQLAGSYINLEYELPNGQKVKLLKDDDIYLGCQLEKKGSDRCYGLAADEMCLLVCEYGDYGSDPEIVVYKRR